MAARTGSVALLALLCWGAAGPAGDGGRSVHFADDFAQDSLKKYRVKGEAAWQKGKIQLGKQSHLLLPIALGATAEVQAVVRLPAAGGSRAAFLAVAGVIPSDGRDEGAPARRLEVVAGVSANGDRWRLLNLSGTGEGMDLTLPRQEKQPLETAWVVRVQIVHGLARVKAWPLGDAEPKAWMSRRYCGLSEWRPMSVAVEASKGAGAVLTRLEVSGATPEKAPSPDQVRKIKEAVTLNKRGSDLGARGKYAEAVRAFRHCLDVVKEVYGPDHPNTARSLANLGALLKKSGKAALGKPYLEQAVALHRKVMGDDHPDTAAALVHLGSALATLGKLAQARPLLEESLAIRRSALGNLHPRTAESLNVLGTLLLQAGEVRPAQRCLEEALTIRRKVLPAGHVSIAESLTNLGQALAAAGEYGPSRRCTEEGLAMFRKALGAGHPHTLTARNNYGAMLERQGDLLAARTCFEQALAGSRKELGEDHRGTAVARNNLAGVLNELGEAPLARALFEANLAFARRELGTEHPFTVSCLNNLGWTLTSLRDFEGARRYFEEALALRTAALPAGHPDIAAVQTNLGYVLAQTRELDGARKLLEASLRARRKALGDEHPEVAHTLLNLASLLDDSGDRQGSRRCFDEALAIHEKRGGEPAQVVAVLNNMGLRFFLDGKTAGARHCFEDALRKGAPLGPDHLGIAVARNNLAGLLAAAGEPRRAWQLHREGSAAMARLSANLLAGSAEREHAGILARWQPGFESLVSLAAASPELAGAVERELLAAVLDWKAASGSSLRTRLEALVVGKDRTASDLHIRLRAVRHQRVQLALHGSGLTAAKAHAALKALTAEQGDLERQLAARVAGYAALARARQAGPEEVARQLPRGAVLVETIRYRRLEARGKLPREAVLKPWYAALLLWRTADGRAEVRLVDLGEAGLLETAIHAWRKAAQRGPIPRAVERDLRVRLWQRLAEALPPRMERLVVAPDGELALIPLEAIRLEDGKYLVEHFVVSYVGSGRDLMPRPLRGETSDVALIVADPDYDQDGGAGEPVKAERVPRGADRLRSGLRFVALPGFAREAEAVGKLLTGRPGWRVVAAQKGDASEDRLAAVKRPRLLYCITHGFFLQDAERPREKGRLRDLELVSGPSRPLPNFGADARLRSGLALAGANKWQARSAKGLSDGLLTALEVENLDLWGTELVVLSACETGLGEVQVGEGVLGLRRAFLLAGAQTVVASLWKVPDAETEKLMTSFFERWLKGAARADALRQAQLELIRSLRLSGNPTRRDAPPLYWAGFICHGQSR
jgi:CHAT domain-containing protein/tetratricopeptide (TPR) repeat protein